MDEVVWWAKRRSWLVVAGLAVAIAEIAFSVQIRTWHGPHSWTKDPRNKIFAASWLASEMWINPWLLLAGFATVILAVVSFFAIPRLANRRSATQ